MLMMLQRYNLEVQFVKGKENVADTLSRAPIKDNRREDNKLHNIVARNIFKIEKDTETCQLIEEILCRTLESRQNEWSR